MTEESGNYEPEFASAVERIYYNRLHLDSDALRLQLADRETRSPLSEMHRSLLEYAISKADRQRGGIRFRQMKGSDELSERLLKTLRKVTQSAEGPHEPGVQGD
ncbi:MAG TPA: hypothetical protein VND22_04300 [Actinomycetota bacterium]|nr:hypothetical protein [Actinomycetota bacterium]